MGNPLRITNINLVRPFAVVLIVIGSVLFYGFYTDSHQLRNLIEQAASYKETLTLSDAAAPSCPESFRSIDPIDWKNANLDTLPAESIMDYFYWTNRASCKLLQYFGGILTHRPINPAAVVGEAASGEVVPAAGLDGHYAVCLDPLSVAPRSKKCLVYSFGIRNEWSYDDYMERYGCQVYSFDPGMNKKSFNRTANIHFYDLALNDVDEGNQNRTLSTLYNMLKPQHGDVAIDHIKIDIEGDEWRIIPQIIKSGMLAKIKQLALEIHLKTNAPDVAYYRNMAGVLKAMEDAGMIRFDSYYNYWSSAFFPALNHTGYFAYIMAWYNNRFITV